MPVSNVYYFYLWRNRFIDPVTENLISRTCFGITKNIVNRTKGYEGHVGHVVNFEYIWQGPERLIRELENKIKSDFYEQIFVGTDEYRYEWINESVPFDTVINWVKWEIANTFNGIVEIAL